MFPLFPSQAVLISKPAVYKIQAKSRGALCYLKRKVLGGVILNEKQDENPNIHLSVWERHRRETKPIINRSIDD